MEFLVNFTLNLSGRLETAKQEIAARSAPAGAGGELGGGGVVLAANASGFLAPSIKISWSG